LQDGDIWYGSPRRPTALRYHHPRVAYRGRGIFFTIDQNGVGELVKIAVNKGKEARPEIKLGICGEHGGDPTSVEFCHQLGLTYVSCSPFRVPIARLAAAQAAINNGDK
jgi:phosphoenolpyruvate synthase/pyruvate phosphate dikinase